jgi:hypothetical protein
MKKNRGLGTGRPAVLLRKVLFILINAFCESRPLLSRSRLDNVLEGLEDLIHTRFH